MKTMGDQARALGCNAYEISSIETGQTEPTAEYLKKLSDWLDLDDAQYKALLKRSENNVIDMRQRFSTSNKSTSMRLFRKISKMDPTQIREFRKKIHGEADNDRRLLGPPEVI